ncbi:MAG: tetratricopeptide repeat protein [Acidobacteria bacterium]|nr:tetratricopeptide repeat protein [Acidobacteriota bacterium]
MTRPHNVSQSWVVNWVFVMALVLGPFLIFVARGQNVDQLEPGKLVVRELKGGEKHTYPISLKANDYLKLVVNQKGIDVVVRLIGPDGKVVQEVNNPNGTQGEEPFFYITDHIGTYILEIESLKKTAQAGIYELKSESIKPATEQDRAEVEIKKLNDELTQLWQAGKYDQGVLLAQQAVEKSEQLLGTDHSLLADSLNYLGLFYKAKGEYLKAEPVYLRAIAIGEKTIGFGHPHIAAMRNNLANLYGARGEYLKAKEELQRALDIFEKTLGPEHQNTIFCLNNLAELYFNLGDTTSAERLFRHTLAIREKVFGPDHPTTADTLQNLAFLHRIKSEYIKAEGLYQRVLTTREKALGPEHPETSNALNGLAEVYRDQGNLAKAESLHQRALAIREKVFGPDHIAVARSLNNLGLLFRDKGDFGKAEQLLLRSQAIREKKLGMDHPSIAVGFNNLALIAEHKGEYAQAESLYQRALEIQEKAVGQQHPDTALALTHIANLNRMKGEYAKAQHQQQQALAIFERVYQTDHPDIASGLNNLSGIYQIQGQIAQAIQCQIQSNDITERDLVRNLISGSEQQKSQYLKKTDHYTNQTLSLHLQAAPQSPDAMRAALTVVVRRKGRALDALTTAIETLRRQQTPEIQKLLDDYARLAGQISILTLRGPETRKLEEHLAYLKLLNEEREKLENEISHKSLEFQAQTTPITLENIQKQIPLNAVLAEFAVYTPYDPKTDKPGTPRFVVYVLNHQGKIHFADLGEAAPIEEAISAFRKVLSNPKTDLVKDIIPAAKPLNQLVLKPVLALIGKAKHLLISPDGALQVIPFAALMDDKGKFLTRQYTLTYLTSGRDLLRLAVKIESQQPPLIVADPDYMDGTGPQMMGQTIGRLIRLIGTRAEGEQLKAILPHANLKTRSDATEQVVKQVSRPGLVHIATHGYFLENTTQSARDPLSDHPSRNIVNLSHYFEKERQANPLLCSLLFFAGANQGGTEENDGVMTALEAAQLNLWGTKLVTLSACDTGLGEVKNGDGVYGLRRALVLAGSESQLMSLWPVSDQATRELMIDYYTRLKTGEGRSEALRNVQLKLLKTPRRQHPFYWASFIQSGEWASLEGKR